MTRGKLPWGWLNVTGERRESQLDLFQEARDDILARARVSLDDLERWRSKEWISFDASELDTLPEPLSFEVVFIRNLARSGLSDEQITLLLSKLDAPYRYDPTRTAYSFAFGWVQIPPMPDEDEVDRFAMESMSSWILTQAVLRKFELLDDLRWKIRFAKVDEMVRRKQEKDE